jgi:hypothetical protein
VGPPGKGGLLHEQGERLQTVFLEEDRIGEYDVTQLRKYASEPRRAV